MLNVPVTASGTATNPDSGATQAVTLNGTFHLTQFTASNNQLFAVGTLDGTLTNDAGTTVATVSGQPQRVTAQSLTASCDALHVQVGPANVNAVTADGYWQVQMTQFDLGVTTSQNQNLVVRTALCALSSATGSSVSLNTSNLPVSAGDLAQSLNQIINLAG